MTTRVSLAIGAGLLAMLAATSPASAQSDDRAVVRGRVVDGTTGRAVGRARLELNIGSAPRYALASPRGEFEFGDVAEGSGTVLAEKSGYTRAWYPARERDTIRLRHLAVHRGEKQDIVIVMYRQPAITGTVVDEYGDPVEGVKIRAWRVSSSGGPTTVRAWGLTNDVGEFRLNNLEPGRYLVAALPSWFGKRDADREVPFYALTFYPGGGSVDQAQAIDVRRGQSVANVDLTLAELPPASVTGIVEDANGQRIGGGGVAAFAVVPGLNLGGRLAIGGASVGANGTFSLQIPAGTYDFEAHGGTYGTPVGWQYSAMLRATVGTSSVTTVTLTTAPPANLSGRVLFESTRKSAVRPGRPSLLLTSLVDGSDECRAATVIPVKPDWTFSEAGVEGRCLVRVDGDEWVIKSVMLDTKDFAGRAIEFRPGQDITGLQIVLTDRLTAVVPRVSDESGATADDYVLLVFGDAPEKPDEQLRVVRTFVPSMFGRTAAGNASRARGLTGLPPGSYHVIALDDVAYDETLDSGFLDALVDDSTPVILTEGERSVVQLHLQLPQHRIPRESGAGTSLR